MRGVRGVSARQCIGFPPCGLWIDERSPSPRGGSRTLCQFRTTRTGTASQGELANPCDDFKHGHGTCLALLTDVNQPSSKNERAAWVNCEEPMPPAKASRDSVLRLLSGDEVARLADVETVPSLEIGDQYLDLERLECGVQTVHALSRLGVGRALPRNGIGAETWSKILAHLG